MFVQQTAFFLNLYIVFSCITFVNVMFLIEGHMVYGYSK